MNKPIDFDASKPIIATGICSIQAQAQEEGKAKKLATVDIQAYNGGKMDVGYWGTIVVDLAGLKASQKTPMLLSHDSWDLESVLGQTDSVTNDGKTLSMSGRIMAENDTSAKVLVLAKNGYEFQASVGVRPTKYRFIKEDETAEANGQTFDGPFYLISAGKLSEISIVPLGADDSTSAKIAASHEENKNNRSNNMPNEKETAATAETIRAAATAEENRIMKIREITKDYPPVTAKAIAEGYSVEKAEVETLKASNAKLTADILAANEKIEGKTEAEKVQAERPKIPAIIIGGKEVKATQSILTAAACMSAGMKSPDKTFNADDCDIAASMKIRSLTGLINAVCASEGKPLNATRHNPAEMIRAAFSTASFANILANVQNKFILQGYGVVEQEWRKIASIRPVVDFKANTGSRLIMSSLLQSLAPTGEIQHGAMSDEARSIQADTKALMLAITRQDIVNDDLNILSEAPTRLGYAASRTLNVDFWAALEAAVETLFTEAHANTTTGALTATTLAVAETLFQKLKDADGNPLGLRGSVLLSGSTAAGPASDLFISQNMVGGTSKSPSGNRFFNKFTPSQSAYLSDDPWLLVANPMALPLMEVAFLNGNQVPTVESADVDFNQLGIQTRCYYDYGVAAGDWRSAVYSTGA